MPTLLNKLRNIVLYVVLAKHDNEQSDLLHRVAEERLLEDLPNYQQVNFCQLRLQLYIHLASKPGTSLCRVGHSPMEEIKIHRFWRSSQRRS